MEGGTESCKIIPSRFKIGQNGRMGTELGTAVEIGYDWGQDHLRIVG